MTVFQYLVLSLFLICVSCDKDDTVEPIDSYWQTALPQEHGLNPDSIQQVLRKAEDLENIYALLVARDNRLVVEKYFHGKGPNDLLHLRSITKNFTSTLTGIAIQQGIIPSLDTTIWTYYPNLVTDEKKAITLRHLLNMSSGLVWNEDQEINPLLDHEIIDPVSVVLQRNLESGPGSAFNYNTVLPHIVSDIISMEVGQTFEDYAKEQILSPLGIDRYQWLRDNNGSVWGGVGLQLTARDLAKFGQLILNDGRWENQSLINAEWVEMIQDPQIQTNGSAGYSLQWWISQTFPTKLFFGNGYGGQALMLLPDKNILVVAMQEFFVLPDQNEKQWRNFVEDLFIPIFNAIEK